MGNKKKIQTTIDILIYENLIPKKDPFQITEQMLNYYIFNYSKTSDKDKGKKFDFRYARKLAGLSLLKLNLNRGVTFDWIKAGLVYVIVNPAFPNHVKIGMTLDLNKRLKSYQTYDPYKKFYVKHYDFVLDRRKKEKEILINHHIDIEHGEWIKTDDSLSLIRKVSDIPV